MTVEVVPQSETDPEFPVETITFNADGTIDIERNLPSDIEQEAAEYLSGLPMSISVRAALRRLQSAA